MNAIAILKAGMVTSVGLTASASCAAMRAAIDAFAETRFRFDGEWLMAAQVALAQPWQGREKLLQMAVSSIQECVSNLSPEALKEVPLLLCLPDAGRPGRLSGLDTTFLREIEKRLRVKFAPESMLFAEGRLGGVKAVERASQLLSGAVVRCLIAGVDSFLVGLTLSAYHKAGRLKTEANSNGFIPGEAGTAVLVGSSRVSSGPGLTCKGLGYGSEPAPVLSEEPLRADGLKEAITNAFKDASATWADVDYRITDANGEQYWFKEAALVLTRTMRVRKVELDLWHPADCIGEIGAAIVPCVLGVALYADAKRYAHGPGVLCHFSADGPERGALVLQGTVPPNRANQVF
jgi:3-oxoacyl-[acyl-carrier-protein] synthase-1